MASPLVVHASCDAVKSSIDAKIKANGVSHYSLDVVDADQADKSGGKVVGQCEGNKAIVYSRGQAKADGDSNGASKESATQGSASPDNGSQVPPPAPTRSGQTGG
ncbi:DUF1161 domain-containing protein [Dyella acidiphila]|nr:DUF1161 domain-containing protein [Dyella acidiphila]